MIRIVMSWPAVRILAIAVALSVPAAAQAPFALLWRLRAEPGTSTFGFRRSAYGSLTDLNGDAFPDVFVASGLTSWNDRRGGFGSWNPPISLVGLMGYTAVADFDVDGDPDFMMTGVGYFSQNPGRLFLNDGRGNFVEVSNTHLPRHPIDSSVSVPCDVDGDGDVDIVLGAFYNSRQPPPVRGYVYLNDGTGHFTFDPQRPSMPVDVYADSVIVPADFDGDGDQDLAIGRATGQNCIYLNDGTGRFQVGASLPTVMCGVLQVGDLDRDGDLDLGLFAYEYGRPVLCLNDGNARFTDITGRLPLIATPWNCGSGAFSDIDEDGDLDVLIPCYPTPVGNNESVFIQQFVNDGSAHFTDATVPYVPLTPGDLVHVSWLTAADIDGDGDADILANDAAPLLHPQRHQSVFWNMTRQVYAPQAARLGAAWDLEIHADPGTLALPAAALRPGYVDLGAVGVFGLDPATTISGPSLLIPQGRVAHVTMTVPNDPRLVGQHLYWQCVFLDSAQSRLILSNTFEETFLP